MAYLSLYRKYRSQSFGDLVGQDHVVRTLQNAISSGRIAHSYLFTGPRGTGKTSTARLLAKALCWEGGPSTDFDDSSEICRAIAEGSFIDVIEMDAASESGVDDIREQIVEAVEYQPMVARYKVFIIDEVHDLSTKAFDALLKTVEEPPSHIIFILATTEFNKVPPTIRSRCQKYEFHRASMSDLVGRLNFVIESEKLEAEPQAVTAIARMADGGYRDALTLLEQAMLTAEDGKITLQQVYDQLGLVSEETVDDLLAAIKEVDVPKIMETLAAVARLGRDPRAILESMLHRLADLTRAAYQVQTQGLDSAREASLHETATRLGRDTILRLRGDLAEAHKVIRDITLPRLWLESELVRLAVKSTRSQAAVAPTEPAAVSVAPARKPTAPVAEAKVTAPAEPAPSPAVEVPKKTGDASADKAAEAWALAKQSLKELSKTLAMKLQDAQFEGRNGDEVSIQFARQLELDWIQDSPKKIAAIREHFVRHLGEEVQLRFFVPKREDFGDTAPVELSLEGNALAALTRQMFGSADAPAETEEA